MIVLSYQGLVDDPLASGDDPATVDDHRGGHAVELRVAVRELRPGGDHPGGAGAVERRGRGVGGVEGGGLRPEPGEGSRGWLDRAAGVLGDHEYGVCVHGDGFGTRSSSLVHVAEAGVTYEFADGPPCRTPFERVEGQI